MKPWIIQFLSLATVACFFAGARAQDSTKVRFLVQGSTPYFVKIDGVLMPVSNIHKVVRGEHDVEIWCPQYQVFKGKLETGNTDSTTFLAKMKIDPSWTGYIYERESYKREVFFKHTAPAFIGGAGLVAAPLLYLGMRNSHEELVKQEFLPGDAAPARAKYQVLAAGFGTSVGLAVIGSALFFGYRSHVKGMNPPVFRHQNPFTLEYFEVSMNCVIERPVVGLALNF